jgi:hypothetical protein
MMKKRVVFMAAALMVLAVFATGALAEKRGNVDLMKKEELLKRMEAQDVIVLDVRKGTDWRASEFKIKGATRVAPRDITKVKYPKDKTIVLYCA